MARSAPLTTENLDWDRLLAAVQAENPQLYRSWFAALDPQGIERGQLTVRVPDGSKLGYLETECREAFVQAAMTITGRILPVRFVLTEQDGPTRIAHAGPLALTDMPLSADYTFDEFVVGSSNRLAHAACRAICSQPGTLYNPLFVHGHSGLGKTHLLQATCAEVQRNAPGARTVFITCETFVNDLVRALETGQLHAFRESARNADLLVIDDVQFLANRESSQEELFHTFNALYQAKRQIILSADAPPTQIPTLEERLVSRFNWGLLAQIDPPDRETRQAILQKKARLRGVDIPPDVLDFVAERVEANIRLLEGALTRLITESQLEEKPLTVETARDVLRNFGIREQRPLQVSEILEAVAKHYGIRVQELLGRKRTRSISQPRHVAMYLARRLTSLSLEEIGVHFGGRDHSTVLHAERTVEDERQQNPRVGEVVATLSHRLSSRG